MVTLEIAKQIALSFPEALMQDHFGRPSFRVRKKIFAILWLKEKRVVLKLSPVNQSVFTSIAKQIIFPVEGGWGKQGWTMVDLKKVKKSMFKDALTLAYCDVAPKKLAEQVSIENSDS